MKTSIPTPRQFSFTKKIYTKKCSEVKSPHSHHVIVQNPKYKRIKSKQRSTPDHSSFFPSFLYLPIHYKTEQKKSIQPLLTSDESTKSKVIKKINYSLNLNIALKLDSIEKCIGKCRSMLEIS